MSLISRSGDTAAALPGTVQLFTDETPPPLFAKTRLPARLVSGSHAAAHPGCSLTSLAGQSNAGGDTQSPTHAPQCVRLTGCALSSTT